MTGVNLQIHQFDNSYMFGKHTFAKMVTDSLLAPSREGIKENSVGGTAVDRNNNEKNCIIQEVVNANQDQTKRCLSK